MRDTRGTQTTDHTNRRVPAPRSLPPTPRAQVVPCHASLVCVMGSVAMAKMTAPPQGTAVGAPSRVLGEASAPAQPASLAPSAPREKKRRRRTRPHEVDILMSAYVQNAFPNEKVRDRLASMVGMTPRHVPRWLLLTAERSRCGFKIAARPKRSAPCASVDRDRVCLRPLWVSVAPQARHASRC